MSRTIWSAMTVLLIAAIAAAQTVNNGNLWRTLSLQFKTAYLKGYIDAMASCSSFATPQLNEGSESQNNQCRALVGYRDNKAIALLTQVTPSQLRDALDQFYRDAANRLIAVPRAIGVIFRRLIGSSEQELREMIEFERSSAAALRPRE